jgi:hypothetical protein
MPLFLKPSLSVNTSSSPTSRPLGSLVSTLRAGALLSLAAAGVEVESVYVCVGGGRGRRRVRG